jgi:hypothetical protein
MDSLEEQSIEVFEVAVVRMLLVGPDVAEVELQLLPLGVEQERLVPSDTARILKAIKLLVKTLQHVDPTLTS